jgi:hypothetical protein
MDRIARLLLPFLLGYVLMMMFWSVARSADMPVPKRATLIERFGVWTPEWTHSQRSMSLLKSKGNLTQKSKSKTK